MARTAVALTTLTANTATADPTPTTADPTNGHVIGSGVRVPLDEVVVRVANTSGGAKTVTLKAGTNPPAFDAILGDVTFSVPATTGVKWVGPLTSARFAQDDGTVRIDLEAGFSGTLTAFRLPRTA